MMLVVTLVQRLICGLAILVCMRIRLNQFYNESCQIDSKFIIQYLTVVVIEVFVIFGNFDFLSFGMIRKLVILKSNYM